MDRPREPLPTRVEDTPELPAEYDARARGRARRPALTLSPAARAAIDGHVRLLLAWTEAINLTGIREPAAVATAHVVDSLSGVGVLRERGIDRFIDLGSGGGYPGLPIAAALPAARALLLEPVAKKAGFLSRRGERDRTRGDASRRRRSGPRRWPPTAAIAAAGRGSPSGPWPASPSSSSSPSRCSNRAARSSPGSAATSTPSWPPRNGRSMRSVADRSRSVPSRSTGSTATDWSSPPRAAASRPGTRATPARASGGHGERHAARLEGVRIVVLSDIHSNLLALDAVLAKVGAVDAIWHLGDVVGYGPEPDGVVDRLKALGAIGVRGNHDAAATGGSEIDWFNPEAKAAMEWTRAAISEPTREWLAALPLRRHRNGLHARPRQPARPDLGVRHLGGPRPGRAVRHLDRARPPRPHPHPDRVHDGRRTDAHAPATGRQHGRARRGPLLPQPGLGRTAARRRPAGELHGPRQRRRDRDAGSGSPTTSRPSARRCAPRACRCVSPIGCVSAPDGRP